MTNYDENLLQGYVDELYNRANWVVAIYTVGGVFLGFVAGAIYDFSKLRDLAIGSVYGAAIGGLIGAYVGKVRSWHFRFEAQRMLLQMQIERNTRWLASWCAANSPPAAGQ